MDFENMPPELMEKARTCKTTDELVALAKEEGVELSDEDLDGIAGGGWGGGSCEERKAFCNGH